MTQPIDTEALLQEAKQSKDKESYRQLEKTQTYRIGAGARATPTQNPSFFIEVILNQSDNTKEVKISQLEKLLQCLKTLHARNYQLTYEDNNSISCESTKNSQDINQEYLSIKSLLKTTLS